MADEHEDFVTGPKSEIVCKPYDPRGLEHDDYKHDPKIIWDANGVSVACKRCGKTMLLTTNRLPDGSREMTPRDPSSPAPIDGGYFSLDDPHVFDVIKNPPPRDPNPAGS